MDPKKKWQPPLLRTVYSGSVHAPPTSNRSPIVGAFLLGMLVGSVGGAGIVAVLTLL